MLTVLLHGFGGSERDMEPIASHIDGRTLNLRAPYREGEGFSWFDWRFAEREPNVGDATESAQRLLDLIDRAADQGEAITAVGWSQGATLIVEAMRLRPNRITTAVLGSGFLVGGTRPTDGELARTRPRTHWVTGDADDVISESERDELGQFLRAHTALSATVLHGIGHSLHGSMTRAIVDAACS
jgi:phospholipase/carboxylesterase